MLIFSRYTWWVAAMVTLALFLTAASQVGALNPFQGAFLKAASPVEGVLDGVFRPVASVLSNITRVNDLESENQALRVENADLQRQLVQARVDSERIKELEQLIQTQGEAGSTMVPANVVSRIALPFTHVISIDAGSSDGISVGMNVLSAQGWLVGTVYKVSGDQSFVRLITDSQSKVNAQVGETATDGSVHGGPNRTLTFELVQGDVNVGDIVTTSGLGGNYQAGIPIAKVTEVSGTSQDLYKTVKLEPLVRISTTRTVLVLTSFLPQRLNLDTK